MMEIPDDALVRVLQGNDKRALCTLCLVSRDFNRVASSDVLWLPLAKLFKRSTSKTWKEWVRWEDESSTCGINYCNLTAVLGSWERRCALRRLLMLALETSQLHTLYTTAASSASASPLLPSTTSISSTSRPGGPSGSQASSTSPPPSTSSHCSSVLLLPDPDSALPAHLHLHPLPLLTAKHVPYPSSASHPATLPSSSSSSSLSPYPHTQTLNTDHLIWCSGTPSNALESFSCCPGRYKLSKEFKASLDLNLLSVLHLVSPLLRSCVPRSVESVAKGLNSGFIGVLNSPRPFSPKSSDESDLQSTTAEHSPHESPPDSPPPPLVQSVFLSALREILKLLQAGGDSGVRQVRLGVADLCRETHTELDYSAEDPGQAGVPDQTAGAEDEEDEEDYLFWRDAASADTPALILPRGQGGGLLGGRLAGMLRLASVGVRPLQGGMTRHPVSIMEEVHSVILAAGDMSATLARDPTARPFSNSAPSGERLDLAASSDGADSQEGIEVVARVLVAEVDDPISQLSESPEDEEVLDDAGFPPSTSGFVSSVMRTRVLTGVVFSSQKHLTRALQGMERKGSEEELDEEVELSEDMPPPMFGRSHLTSHGWPCAASWTDFSAFLQALDHQVVVAEMSPTSNIDSYQSTTSTPPDSMCAEMFYDEEFSSLHALQTHLKHPIQGAGVLCERRQCWQPAALSSFMIA